MINQRAIPFSGQLIFFVATIFFFYEFILRVSPGVMANELMKSFQINAEALGFMGSIFFQAYALMQIPAGICFDVYRPKTIFLFASILCALGTLIFSFAPYFYLAFLGRLCIGIGASFGFIGALKVAELYLPLQSFGIYSGILMTLGFIGAVFADNILGLSLQHFSWEKCMFYLGIFGLLIVVMIFCTFPTKIANTCHSKISGTDLIQILKNINVWNNGLVGFLMYFPTSAFAELWGKTYLQEVHHLSTPRAIFAMTMVFIGWAIGAPIAGRMSDLIEDQKKLLALGSLLAALCISLVLYIPSLNYNAICFLLMCFGIFSATEVLNFVYAREISPHGYSATTIAVTNMVVVCGGACSQFIVGWILTTLNPHSSSFYTGDDYQKAFIILPVALIVAAILSLLLKKTP